MFVRSIMIHKNDCITAKREDSLREVLKILEKHQIDGLPILDGESYEGIVTRYNIFQEFFQSNKDRDDFLDSTPANSIAIHKNKFLIGEEVFEKTLIELKDIPLLAVADDNYHFLGVVTRYDLLEQFQSAFGFNRRGVRITLTSVETEGRIARLSEIAHHFQVHIISVITFDETDKLVRRIVIKIEKNNNFTRFLRKLEEHGFRMIGMTEDN